MKPIAFIFISKGASPAVHHGVYETEQHQLSVYGVATIEEGCSTAKTLVNEGCRIVELCGGFGPDGARRVIAAINGAVPVGYIDYFPEEHEKLALQRRGQTS